MRVAPDPRLALAAAVVVALLAGCAGTAAGPRTTAGPTSARTPATIPSVRATDAAVQVRGTAIPAPRTTVAPTRLRVADRDVDVAVVPTGVRRDGSMALPADPSVAGWYRFGPDLDAGRGSIVVAAHVDSLEYGVGPFARLRDAPAGTRIVLRGDDGSRHVYAVTGVERVRKRALPVGRIFDRDGPRRLVVITCGGTFDETTRTYSDNVLVHAEPVA